MSFFKLLLRILCLAVFSAWAGHALAVGNTASTPQVKAELLAAVGEVHAGETVLVGVRQRILEHWHTYWINPGDSGIATTIEWKLPAGAEAGAIQWPIPDRYKLGPVTNYGYSHEVTLLSAIKLPADLKPGSRVSLQAHVGWLVCKESCIPQEVDLAMSLPVAAGPAPAGVVAGKLAAVQASLPVVSPWPGRLALVPGGLELRVAGANLVGGQIKDVWFYPEDWGRIDHGAAQALRVEEGGSVITLKVGESPAKPGSRMAGVLVVSEEGGAGPVRRGFRLEMEVAGAPTAAAGESTGLLAALGLAFLGGLILNLMPCVFPVLSIKALSLMKHAEYSPAQVRLHGLAYTAGVLVCFGGLGGVLVALKAGGAQIGWGFQFQSPLFVLLMAWLMFGVGLSLSGMLEIGASAAGIGSALANRSGYAGSFFTGALATVVATPCTAPFMGAALGYALTQPAPALMAVFLSLGLGLASPYLALTCWPPLQKRLPKPGAWMERVKEFLAFPMYGAAIWLVWVLAQQAGSLGVLAALGGMLALALAVWLLKAGQDASNGWRLICRGLALLALGAALGGAWMGLKNPAADAAVPSKDASRNWEPFSPERLQALRAEGKPVFLNFTAAWCITCLANEQVALSVPRTVEAFRQAGVTYLKGDWTNQDPRITKVLAEFGRSGVPLYVFYPAGQGREPVMLPQLLTPDVVLATLTSPNH